MRAFLVLSGASNTDAVLPKFTDCSNSILRQVMTKEGAAKITKALWHHQMMPKSVVFLAPTQVGGINGHIEAIKSTANWMEAETGERQRTRRPLVSWASWVVLLLSASERKKLEKTKTIQNEWC